MQGRRIWKKCTMMRGSFIYEVSSFMKYRQIHGKIYPIICPEQEVQDIDTEEDWKMAELKAEYLKKHKEEGS